MYIKTFHDWRMEISWYTYVYTKYLLNENGDTLLIEHIFVFCNEGEK